VGGPFYSGSRGEAGRKKALTKGTRCSGRRSSPKRGKGVFHGAAKRQKVSGILPKHRAMGCWRKGKKEALLGLGGAGVLSWNDG